MDRVFEIENITQTERLGRHLGSMLFPGAVVALIGPLGAGKTYLSRAIAEGLEIANPALVTSPTFVLIQEYAARFPIYHFDAYRLKNDDEFRDLGVEEYFHGDGVCLVEWADKFSETLPTEHLRIELKPLGETAREATITSFGTKYDTIVQQLQGF